jgi:hypothetical protein
MTSHCRPGILVAVVAALCGSGGRAESNQNEAVTNGPGGDMPDLPAHFEAGLVLRFMPIGWFDLADPGDRDFRAYPALGFAPFVDYGLGRYVSVGISPEVTLNVYPNRAMTPGGHMLTIDARLQARYPGQKIEPYAIVTGGYSVIWLSDVAPASGPAVGATLGLRLRVAKRHAMFAELSYQRGFQRTDEGAYSPSYLITGAGWQVGF